MAEIDPDISDYLARNGYLFLRKMPDGHIAGINKFLFTYGLCTRLDFVGYHARWCFEDFDDACTALALWDGVGDPPGPWIKQKGPVERVNPLLFDIISVYDDGREHSRRKADPDWEAVWRLTNSPAAT